MNACSDVVGNVIAVASAIFVGFQILNSIKLDRHNRTFQMITELDRLMDDPQNFDYILKMGLDEFSSKVGLYKAVKVYNEKAGGKFINRKFIYKILNYYELLSIAVFSKSIDAKLLQRFSGYRILNAYVKLEPFIFIIRNQFESQQSLPYQHFDALYQKWIKLKQFKNYGGRL